MAFRPSGFHTVDFPAPGGRPFAVFTPTGKKLAGINDEEGVPFWFNGQDEIGFTPGLLRLNYGKTFVKGTTRISSGLPFGNKLKPLTVRFPKTGLFTYYCDLHRVRRARSASSASVRASRPRRLMRCASSSRSPPRSPSRRSSRPA